MWYPQLAYTQFQSTELQNQLYRTLLNCLYYKLRQSISYCTHAVKPINIDQSTVKAIARVDCMPDQMITVTLITYLKYTQMSRDSAHRILANPIQYCSTFCIVQAFPGNSNSSSYLATGFQHSHLAQNCKHTETYKHTELPNKKQLSQSFLAYHEFGHIAAQGITISVVCTKQRSTFCKILYSFPNTPTCCDATVITSNTTTVTS